MTSIVGREPELSAGARLLADARDALAALVLEGEAGIGKTIVWSGIVDAAEAAGFAVLRARPAAAEASLTFSALGDLLEPVPDAVFDGLPPPQRRAVDAALLRAEPGTDGLEERVLGTALRSVLAALAEQRPVLLALDDVQWIDPPSAAALAYALRRSSDARIGIVASRRSGEPSPLDIASLIPDRRAAVLRLGPLSVGALHHVLKARLDRTPSRSTLVRIHEASGGNPFYALEIARLMAVRRADAETGPLPIPRDIRDLVSDRIARLPAETREVLLAAAALGTAPTDVVGAALARRIESDVGAAEREGIARIEDGRVAFGHPLYAGAVYAGASDADRRSIHRRLAGVVEGDEAQARHLARAVTGPDASVAADLERAAREAAARGTSSAAVELLEWSLRLTPDGDDAERFGRMIRLGISRQRAGDTAGAEAVLLEVAERARHGRLRARALLDAARIAFEADAGGRAQRLAGEAIGEAGDDAELLAEAHAVAAAVRYDDRRVAGDHARVAMRLLDGLADPDPAVASLVLIQFVTAELNAGRPLPKQAVERALELERIAPAPHVGERMSATLGVLLKLDDDLDGARPWIEAAVAAAVDEGDEGSLPYVMSHLPTLELAAGDWARAEETALRHLAVSIECDQESQRLQALYNCGLVHVLQGRVEVARREIAELLEAVDAAGDSWSLGNALGLLGMLESSLGDARAALEPLLRATETRDELHERFPRRHEPDLVEVLVALGDVDRARAVALANDERCRAYGRHSPLAQAARCLAIVAAAEGRLDDAVRHLDDALAEHRLAPVAFDRARTLLVVGQVRRRRRERAAAKAAFEEAAAAFEGLGARLWLARTRDELARVGIRRARADELTEGERRVAELAAAGRTNREVAAALFLSPKTVEANLARAYRKLGVRSRAELGRVMALAGAPGDDDRLAG